MKLTYSEQLRHPNWQKRRLDMLNKAGWHCQKCAENNVELHVHHLRYVKGRMAWEYEDKELQVLCSPCHQETHEDLDSLILEFGWVRWSEVSGLLSGFYSPDDGSLMAPGLARAGQVAQLVQIMDKEDSALLVRAAQELVRRMFERHAAEKTGHAESNPS